MERELQRQIRSKIKREKDSQVIIDLLAKYEVDIKILDGTALNYAAIYGRYDIAKFLLEKGADVNALYEGDYTPLMAAADNQDPKMIDLILSYDPKVNLKDKHGNTALGKVAFKENQELCEKLMRSGADPFEHESGIVSAYQASKNMDHTEMVEFFEKFK